MKAMVNPSPAAAGYTPTINDAPRTAATWPSTNNNRNQPAYFYPYYFLLGLAGLYHGVTGLASALARFGVRFAITPWLPLVPGSGA